MTLTFRPLLLAALAAVSLQARAELNVVACEPEWASLATELGGDKLKVTSTTTALQDPHHIEARPSLIARMRGADLLVCTGMELEVGWLPVLLQQSANASSRRRAGEAGASSCRSTCRRGSIAATAMSMPPAIAHPARSAQHPKVARRCARLAQIDAANAPLYQTGSILLQPLDRGDAQVGAGGAALARAAGGRAPQEHELPLSWLACARSRRPSLPGVEPNGGH
jgi:zinc/manganese transport system substrate-binding protein